MLVGDACHFIKVDELRGVHQIGSAEVKEEIDGCAKTDVTGLYQSEVIVSITSGVSAGFACTIH